MRFYASMGKRFVLVGLNARRGLFGLETTEVLGGRYEKGGIRHNRKT